jgi:hypothetical protein
LIASRGGKGDDRDKDEAISNEAIEIVAIPDGKGVQTKAPVKN